MRKVLKKGGRYILAVLFAVVLCIIAAGAILTEDKAAGDKKTETVSVREKKTQKENKGWKDSSTNPLQENSDPAVERAVRSYYTAREDEDSFTEGYEDLRIYTKKGRYAGTYLAFVRYNMKIRDIYTKVPGLKTLYLETDRTSGQLLAAEEPPDRAAREAVSVLASQEDVKALMQEVQTAYNEAVASDAMLKEALQDLAEAAGNS